MAKLKHHRIRFYANIVLNGIKELEDIPEVYQEAVQEEINKRTEEMDKAVQEELKKLGF